MIHLEETEKSWIKLAKGHYNNIYPYTDSWVNTAKPLFMEIYGWNPDEDNNYQDYLNCLFQKLLEIQLKIQDDQSGSNQQLLSVFKASFKKEYQFNAETPIERAIFALFSLLQNNQVIGRYEL